MSRLLTERSWWRLSTKRLGSWSYALMFWTGVMAPLLAFMPTPFLSFGTILPPTAATTRPEFSVLTDSENSLPPFFPLVFCERSAWLSYIVPTFCLLIWLLCFYLPKDLKSLVEESSEGRGITYAWIGETSGSMLYAFSNLLASWALFTLFLPLTLVSSFIEPTLLIDYPIPFVSISDLLTIYLLPAGSIALFEYLLSNSWIFILFLLMYDILSLRLVIVNDCGSKLLFLVDSDVYIATTTPLPPMYAFSFTWEA